MKILFKNANVIDSDYACRSGVDLIVDGKFIAYLGAPAEKLRSECDRVINSERLLLIPGLYNSHTHLPMSILKGYAEDMNLQDWLFNKIFPAEDRLTPEIVRTATLLSAAEMIKNGVISCTDMYFFC